MAKETKLHHIPERTDKPIQERFVNMSNALARSAQGLKLSEKRAVALALAKTDSKPFKDLQLAMLANGFTVRLSSAEYAEAYDVDSDTAYSQLKSAGKSLMRRQVRTLEHTKRGLKEVETNWCGQCTYHHGEGWIEIAFTGQISPHLLGLRKAFTSYKLKQASALRSVYSWQLLQCLESWKETGKWSPSIEEFNHAMEVPKSFLGNFGMTNRRVLQPALKELREKDNMDIKLELEKSGRKVIGLIFKFQKNPQGALDLS
jgi:plasmid replication initiation protein